MIILPILTASLTHVSFQGRENAHFELGGDLHVDSFAHLFFSGEVAELHSPHPAARWAA